MIIPDPGRMGNLDESITGINELQHFTMTNHIYPSHNNSSSQDHYQLNLRKKKNIPNQHRQQLSASQAKLLQKKLIPAKQAEFHFKPMKSWKTLPNITKK